MKLGHRVVGAEVDWKRFKYMVFDAPTHKSTYEERYGLLGEPKPRNTMAYVLAVDRLANHAGPYIQVAPRVVCKGMEHFESHFQDILDAGGEGVILRDPQAPFTEGRCSGYLKH